MWCFPTNCLTLLPKENCFQMTNGHRSNLTTDGNPNRGLFHGHHLNQCVSFSPSRLVVQGSLFPLWTSPPLNHQNITLTKWCLPREKNPPENWRNLVSACWRRHQQHPASRVVRAIACDRLVRIVWSAPWDPIVVIHPIVGVLTNTSLHIYIYPIYIHIYIHKYIYSLFPYENGLMTIPRLVVLVLQLLTHVFCLPDLMSWVLS